MPLVPFYTFYMVFDAILNDTGPSLYNCLYLDPFLCECLVGLWLCFHINNIAFISDIEKIFLQILLHKNKKDFFDFFDLKMLKNLNVANCRAYGRQKLLSACVSIWTESHKICQAWVVFVLTDYGQTSQIIELNKLLSASQPILTNRYSWICFIQSKRWFSSENFLFSHNPS